MPSEDARNRSDRELLERIMADLTALNAAIAQLQTDVQRLITDFQASNDTSGVDAATASLTALDASVNAADPAPAPAPAPEPAPEPAAAPS
jgi:outer membrane murein-binding lipoprotein Lpp